MNYMPNCLCFDHHSEHYISSLGILDHDHEQKKKKKRSDYYFCLVGFREIGSHGDFLQARLHANNGPEISQ